MKEYKHIKSICTALPFSYLHLGANTCTFIFISIPFTLFLSLFFLQSLFFILSGKDKDRSTLSWTCFSNAKLRSSFVHKLVVLIVNKCQYIQFVCLDQMLYGVNCEHIKLHHCEFYLELNLSPLRPRLSLWRRIWWRQRRSCTAWWARPIQLLLLPPLPPPPRTARATTSTAKTTAPTAPSCRRRALTTTVRRRSDSPRPRRTSGCRESWWWVQGTS